MLARLKFEISGLVEEILNQVDSRLFKSSGTTFLDPAMGGGQFVFETIKRLKEQGHSYDSIKTRVFGFESNIVYVNYVKERYLREFGEEIPATLRVGGLEELETLKMRFDLVMGNPPYKNGNETGGASSLWRKFVKRGWILVKDCGYFMMITPQFSNSSRDIGFIFRDFQTKVVWTQIAKYFPGIGSSFFAWVVRKIPKTKPTFFIDENLHIDVTEQPLPNDLKSIAIIEKMNNKEKFECLSSPEYLHTSVADGKDEHILSKNQSDRLSFLLRRTSGKTYSMWGSILPTDYYRAKVVFTFSGNPHYRFHDEDTPIGTIKFQSGHILVNDKTEGENLISLYQSKLYRFYMGQFTSGGMKGASNYELPKLDLSRTWTDQELYAHFGLTDEEIRYIEEQVK